jgi:hypothetical protein
MLVLCLLSFGATAAAEQRSYQCEMAAPGTEFSDAHCLNRASGSKKRTLALIA